MRDRVWISFDLAPGGDQDGLYAWLRSLGARECGPCLATFYVTYDEDLPDELLAAMQKAVRLGPADRIYLLFKDPVDGEMTGRFIFGSRAAKRPGIHSPQPLTLLQ